MVGKRSLRQHGGTEIESESGEGQRRGGGEVEAGEGTQSAREGVMRVEEKEIWPQWKQASKEY